MDFEEKDVKTYQQFYLDQSDRANSDSTNKQACCCVEMVRVSLRQLRTELPNWNIYCPDYSTNVVSELILKDWGL